MAARIIDGKAVAARIRAEVKAKAAALTEKGTRPGLAVILVGDDPASRIYVNGKKKACAELGLYSEGYDLPATIPQAELIALIGRLNADPRIHGILVQLPLPAGFDERAVLAAIDPRKDVDGLHPVNMGRLLAGLPGFVPCTPAGVMELIREAGTEIKGAECVVVGRSELVGKPAALLLLAAHGTVTICHSRTRNLAEVCRRADILVVAVGRPGLVTAGMIKPGATVIDVGTNRLPDGRLVGDVDFAAALEVAGAITPVPGGVGPMTITMLMWNTLQAALWAMEGSPF
ncbi:MAG: bifunctional methylenetetrahydrofolate dehydrogenase/methenyltetrahydrofolate cyclohydrolase FolD [Firmicutes bacterium]|nr:bifunctional methylenetetrahydrofolate dehydrogenase/methenyltetrahydrofolate cyclohydrolase FolD [Bacillota bacterium]